MKSMDILALGEALVEFVRIEQSPDEIEQQARPLYSQGFGGDTSNALIAAARQAAKVGYISAVGADPLGQELLDLWTREKVDTSHVDVHETNPTGVYFVQPHASGRHFSYARRGSAASQYQPDSLPLDAIANARLLHTSALSMAISESMRKSIMQACQAARKSGTLVSFDTNLRLNLWDLDTARKAIEDVLPHVDIVLPSDDEARQLCGSDTTEAAISYFQQFGPELVILTRGDQGALVTTKEQQFSVPPVPTTAVDSTGAGDCFAGAFLAHYLETDDIEFSARCAAAAASAAVSGFGAIDSIPDREAVLQVAGAR